MGTTLAQVLRHFGPRYLSGHRLSTPQAKAWRAIVACRTAALGGQQLACDGCGASQWRWHSCRNRHCPQCQSRARDAWRRARLAELLNVPYSHLVFTLPHEASAMGLLVLPMSFAVEAEPLVMAWHPRHDADPAHMLLRQQLLNLLAAVREK